MHHIQLYQYEISPFADKVRRALRLKNLPFEIIEVRPSQIRKIKHITPTQKLPAIDIDGKVTVDSSDIIRELDNIVPDMPLIPTDPVKRAYAHILEDWSDESLYFYDMAIRNKANNIDRLINDFTKYETGIMQFITKRLLPGMMHKSIYGQGLGRKDTATLTRLINEHFIALETLLESNGEWLVGNSISVADISIAAMLHVLKEADEPASLLTHFPRLCGWKNKIDGLTLG